ncbi:hypothetical protein [Pandoraea sp. ISTKB]|uniref:DUF4376 domain-containing protein n=1 Tax=Pandoraea sp. ISTKB TaxID=1586708 RepID=UPI00084767D6|nr:hypothetical protein [Pandoraea sp. ISTKB]ODP33069.1 hypothetical protein A9762_20715 [Pandoraea sp. ISTKB]
MGKKFAAFDEQGNIVAQYDSVDSPVPKGLTSVVELTDEQYRRWTNEPTRWYLPEGVFTAAPAPSDEYLLSLAKAVRIAELAEACRAEIHAGFSSSALDSPFVYPANDVDQQNLSASVLDSLMPGIASDWTTPFWCADAAGAWAFREHTAAQIQQVARDAKTAILSATARRIALTERVNACVTQAEVSVVAWNG